MGVHRGPQKRRPEPAPSGPRDGGSGAHGAAAWVLDASAVLSGKPMPAGARLLVPSSVLGEVEKRGRDQRHLAYLLETGLIVSDPLPLRRAEVEEAALRTGDARRLSATDVDVLALALGEGARIATDDYSIQNLASVLGVAWSPVSQRGITEVITWHVRCIGCRKTFDRDVPECDVCGSPVKSVRARS